MTTTYQVVGMTCGHCANAVTDELKRLAGVTDVNVDVAGGTVAVTSSVALTETDVAAAVGEAGYQLAG